MFCSRKLSLGRLMQCIFFCAAASSFREASTICNIATCLYLHCSSCMSLPTLKQKQTNKYSKLWNDQSQSTLKCLLEPWIGASKKMMHTVEYFEFYSSWSLAGLITIFEFKDLVFYGTEKQDMTTQKSLQSFCLETSILISYWTRSAKVFCTVL